MNEFDLEKLLEILPKLIRENDTVKGAIITALSGVVATREDIQQLIKTMDRRFNEQQKVMDRRFNEQQKAIEKLSLSITEQQKAIRELSLSIMRIESKEGELLEKTVLDLMKESLLLQDIDPDKIRRERVVDSEGMVFYKNYSTDIDIILKDGNTFLIEVKATSNTQDVNHFLQNVKLYELVTGKKDIRPILIALRITPQSFKLAEKMNVKVIKGEFLTF